MSTTINPSFTGVPSEPSPPSDNYLNHGTSIASWIFTVDHKRIGIMYMVMVVGAFFLGGVFALLVRADLVSPGASSINEPVFLHVIGNTAQLKEYEEAKAQLAAAATPEAKAKAQSTVDAKLAPLKATMWDFYNHMFTLHGAVMVFMVIIPAIPAILGNFVLPMMLGAKDVAFPRVNLASLYCYIVGAVFFVWILLSGTLHVAGLHLNIGGIDLLSYGGVGLDTGWTFYTPYSTTTSGSVVAAVFGAFVMGFSSILTGVNFIATIHMLRPKGMTWFKMPLFLWALYSTSLIQILATPVLAITLLLLIAERTLKVGIFDPAYGGDPVLFQHFFWFYSHPAVYIMILPGMGVISELIAVHSRKHIFGYTFIAYSSIAIALLGFLVWGHHMFISGQSPLANAVFSLITFSIAVPSAIKVFNWITTMYKGSIRLNAPMTYALGFLILFTIGGLTGLFLGCIATDVPLTNTYFVVAHFHYVMVGSTLFAFFGGMYHWWPKMVGKMYDENLARTAAIIIFIGFNITFFPQFIAGSQGMPRRYASYDPKYTSYHQISTFGAFTMGFGLSLAVFNFAHSLIAGKKAAENPWGANSLEWHSPSPPPHDNFTVQPVATDPYDFSAWIWDETVQGYIKDPNYVPVPVGAHLDYDAH